MPRNPLTPFQWGGWLAMSACLALFPLGIVLKHPVLRQDLFEGRVGVIVLILLLWLPLAWASWRFMRQVDERDPWASVRARRRQPRSTDAGGPTAGGDDRR